VIESDKILRQDKRIFVAVVQVLVNYSREI